MITERRVVIFLAVARSLQHDPFNAIVVPRPIGWISTSDANVAWLSHADPSKHDISTWQRAGHSYLELTRTGSTGSIMTRSIANDILRPQRVIKMSPATLTIPERRVFSIFISYASEDESIATAVATCFKTALPDLFAEVNLDKDFLEPGSAFKNQIGEKLQEANVFIIIYSGTEKPSHGFTGWEVGYFDRVMRDDTQNRKKISLYLYGTPPAITANEQGISLGLSKNELHLSLEQFESGLSVSEEEPICKEIESWQEEVGKNIEQMGFSRPHRKAGQEPARCVRNLKVAIFQYLKGTIESVVKPQKQITVRVKGSALEQSSDNLPLEAEIRPFGAGPSKGSSMSIFGLSDETITWKRFLELTAGEPFADSWQIAITSVVLSAFPDRVDVDNCQVIFANDGKTGYRVILTTATKFYDDYREYNIYFVEMLQRGDYGEQDTTYLLKGLELVCRFRSMFLEPVSEFLGENIVVINPIQLPVIASDLLKELNFLHRDAQEARLDKPGMWARYVDVEHIKTIAEAYRPCESRLREIIPQIMVAKSKPERLKPLRDEIAETLTLMEKAVRPENALLLREMAARLNRIVEHQDQGSASKMSIT
jgi:hypothetical protein